MVKYINNFEDPWNECMNNVDKLFDMNMVLMSVFSYLEGIIDEKGIELVYDIDATVPKELKGDAEVLSLLLTQILTFVLENTNKKEIVLFLSAPKDFLYEESISFEIRDNDLSEVMIVSFLDNRLSKNLELLHAEVIVEDEDPSDIHINVPFKLNELGNRRYYRLPDISMLGKKVLLICESPKVAASIEKMFKYFLYDVTVGLDEYKKQGSDLIPYDILVIDDRLATDEFENMITKVKKESELHYVILQGSRNTGPKNRDIESTDLVKPVMQESIYELIISLFQNRTEHRNIKLLEKTTIINIEKYIDVAMKKEEKAFANKRAVHKPDPDMGKNEIESVILDSKEGEQNAHKMGLVYAKELNKFLESFTGSDRYFRQVVNDKQTWQIKEFCIDLEKHARELGAQSMVALANDISLLFVYDKLDMLPVYTNKYHMELEKLIAEIKSHLN